MNRVASCNDFLKRMYELSKDKPLDENTVYSNLIKINVDPSEYGRLDKDFNNIYDEFSSYKTNIFMYNSFLYASYKDDEISLGVSDVVKMYVPLKKEYACEGFKQILNFLEQNNIPHQSKIASSVRFDDICLRIRKKEDALKVQSFLEQNKYIQEGLIRPNPFAISFNGIAYAIDGNLSYNSIIADIIAKYINHLRENNIKMEPSFQGLRLFVRELYNNYFINGSKISELDNSEMEERFAFADDYYCNCMEIYELITLALNPSKGISNYYNHYDILSNPEYNEKRHSIIRNIIYKNANSSLEINQAEMNKLLSDLVNILINKYGMNDTRARIAILLEQKNFDIITRDYGLRTKLYEKKDELFSYCEKVYNNNAEMIIDFYSNEKVNNQTGKSEMTNLLDKMCYISKRKYGRDGAIWYLNNFFNTGDFKNFTREDNLRSEIIKKGDYFKEFLNNVFSNNAEAILDYYERKKSLEKDEKKEEALIMASLNTYLKYVDSNINNNQLINALKKASKGDYLGFTNDNYARQLLINRVKSNEIENVIKDILSKENIDYRDGDIYVLFNMYIGDKAIENKQIKQAR